VYKFITAILITLAFNTGAQPNTIGLQYTDYSASEGYSLFSPKNSSKVYLINNCGEVVHFWTCSSTPRQTSYILEDGTLLRSGTGFVEKLDWDSNVIWTTSYSDFGISQHHDIEPLPNGNVLILAQDEYTLAEILAEGKNTSFSESLFRLDKIIEIEPAGTNSANIVWEWKFFDHLIQDFDNSKPNFGITEDNPGLLDVNFNAHDEVDFTHVNSIDYNEALDQILLSARHLNEILIIDHSTNTAEAASHLGGNSNKGGDFLWRWGNPQTYGQGTESDRKLGLQHDAKWIEAGNYAGSISVFNNQDPALPEYSSVGIVTPSIMTNEYQMTSGKFDPLEFDWTWDGDILGTPFNNVKQSGAQILPDDHVLTIETSKGRITEIDADGNVIWVYINPQASDIFDQYENPSSINAFRATKYSTDYPGFTGKSFSNQGPIENLNSISDSCAVQASAHLEPVKINQWSFSPVPASNELFFKNLTLTFKGEIFDLKGNLLIQFDQNVVDVSSLSSGTYFFMITGENFIYRDKFLKN